MKAHRSLSGRAHGPIRFASSDRHSITLSADTFFYSLSPFRLTNNCYDVSRWPLHDARHWNSKDFDFVSYSSKFMSKRSTALLISSLRFDSNSGERNRHWKSEKNRTAETREKSNFNSNSRSGQHSTLQIDDRISLHWLNSFPDSRPAHTFARHSHPNFSSDRAERRTRRIVEKIKINSSIDFPCPAVITVLMDRKLKQQI